MKHDIRSFSEEEVAAFLKEAAAKTKKSRARPRSKFVMFPDVWDCQLAGVKADGCTYRVAIHLLREAWRSQSKRVKLANIALGARNVSRWSKQRALEQLAQAGLITIEQEARRSPVVTLRLTD